jgi:hypothetical protein
MKFGSKFRSSAPTCLRYAEHFYFIIRVISNPVSYSAFGSVGWRMRRHWSVVIVQWAEEAAVSGRKHSRKVKWLLQRRPSPTGNRCLRQLLRDLYRLKFILFCVWYLWPTAMTVLTRATKVSNNNGHDYCRCMDGQSVTRASFLSHRICSLFRNVVENLWFWRQLTPALTSEFPYLAAAFTEFCRSCAAIQPPVLL